MGAVLPRIGAGRSVSTTEARPLLLRVSGLRKTYGAVEALRDVTFEVARAEIVALVGDNGAGKSTTIKIIAGTEASDGGEIHFDGKSAHIRSPLDSMNLGIQTVYQDLALCDNLSIVANLYLGRELHTGLLPRLLSGLRDLAMQKEAAAVLGRLEINLPALTTPVAALSGGQRQAVAVARAVLWGSKLVILDEPTAALGVAQTRMVLNLIRQLAEHGIGVLLISHNLGDVFEIAHRIVVLRQGLTVGNFVKGETTPDRVVAAITGVQGGTYA